MSPEINIGERPLHLEGVDAAIPLDQSTGAADRAVLHLALPVAAPHSGGIAIYPPGEPLAIEHSKGEDDILLWRVVTISPRTNDPIVTATDEPHRIAAALPVAVTWIQRVCLRIIARLHASSLLPGDRWPREEHARWASERVKHHVRQLEVLHANWPDEREARKLLAIRSAQQGTIVPGRGPAKVEDLLDPPR